MKKLFYIDYPQEHIEGQMYRYRCIHCKEETTIINGRLEGHLPTCEYRIKLENAGYESESIDLTKKLISHDTDDFD
jgi:DNA-directed RNA polymerase subunit RPC12/RpoP